ncbi:MAG: hypothetical protein ABIS21_04730, partial [Acidimicrobiales bacterium]
MTTLVTEGVLDAPSIERLLAPRDGLVLERREGTAGFSAVEGPFQRYRRTVDIGPKRDGDERREVRQSVDYELGIPWFGWLFGRAVRHRLGPLEPPRGWPWWSPPERISPGAAATLAALCVLSMVTGYLGTILTQTITFAAQEFGADKGAQSIALAAVRA